MVMADEFLKHYGKKGMKWGVRRAAKKSAKADKKWQANIYSVHGAVAVHNAAAGKANNGGLAKLNGQVKYKNLNLFDKPNSPLTKAYYHEYNQLSAKWNAEAVREVHGKSPSGKYKATLDTSNKNQWRVKVSKVDASHANVDVDNLPDFIYNVEHDDSGYIILMAQIKTELTQSQLTSEKFISHYGKKGMRWGVRTKRSVKEVQVRKNRQKASDKRRTLSDSDLKKNIERISNEKRLKELVSADLKPGRTVAKRIMSESGQKVARTVIAGAGLLAIKATLEKKFDPKEAVSYLAPKPKNK